MARITDRTEVRPTKKAFSAQEVSAFAKLHKLDIREAELILERHGHDNEAALRAVGTFQARIKSKRN